MEHIIEKAKLQIEKDFDRHVERLQEFIRQRTVSPLNIGMEDGAKLVAEYFRELIRCQKVDIVPTDGYPLVVGHYDAGAERTLAIYLMYDTQPADEPGWSVDPFAAEIVERADFGRTLLARGAINSKGPMMAFLNACESILKTEGKLPVNLVLIAEGEEEMGSESFIKYVRDNADLFRSCDGVFMPLPAIDEHGTAKLFFGVKGNCYFELECSGALWGRGPKLFDIHSSSKAIVDSPAWRLVKALSTMVTDDGNTVLIEGFYDDVAPANATDNRLLDELALKFDPAQMRIEIDGVDRWIDDISDPRELMERYLFQPTLNIDGIWGGYIDPGSKTVLPHKVECKIDIRLVPNMDPDTMMQRVREHLDRHGYSDILVRPLHVADWAKMDPESDLAVTLIETLKGYGREVLVFPTAPGTGPWSVFTRDGLSLPCALGGLGIGGRAHAPDEYFVIEGKPGISDLREAEQHYVDFLFAYAMGETTVRGVESRE